MKKRRKIITTDTEEEPKRKKPKKSKVTVEFIGSGAATLNCCLSGKAKRGGWARARVGNIVGDKSSGKTAIALEAAFWFYNNIKKVRSKIFPKVKRYSIVYNNSEGVMDFDVDRMYGPKFRKKVKWIKSPNVEHFCRDYYRRVERLAPGHSLLYIVDTLDFLRSIKAIDRFKDSVRKDSEMKGSYDGEKQKVLGAFFATTSEHINNNEYDATLLIVSQIRGNFDQMSFKKYSRSGGFAFGHAIHQELWLREKKKIPGTKMGEKRIKGIEVAGRMEKNKCAKPYRECNFTILYDYGIDNLSSMIDYLWGSKNIKFDGQIFKTKKKFIKFIEENKYAHLVEAQTEDKWRQIEEAFEKEIEDRARRW